MIILYLESIIRADWNVGPAVIGHAGGQNLMVPGNTLKFGVICFCTRGSRTDLRNKLGELKPMLRESQRFSRC
jgi:hypothetical protein